jgi:hypothetical protein
VARKRRRNADDMAKDMCAAASIREVGKIKKNSRSIVVVATITSLTSFKVIIGVDVTMLSYDLSVLER